MKEKQAIPFQVAPQMIEMDVQRNVHQIGGHMQSEKHLKNMHQLSNLMHSMFVGALLLLHHLPMLNHHHMLHIHLILHPHLMLQHHHMLHLLNPCSTSSSPMCCTPSTTPRVFHLLNSHQLLRRQPFQIFLVQILPIQTCILCKRTTFSLVLVENNTWCSMVGCTHMSRF